MITDDTRIKAALPTIKYAVDEGAKVILLSHLGRPDGEKDPQYSLKPVAERLKELINVPVYFVDETRGEKVERAVSQLKNGEILVIENTRFEKGETKKMILI